MADKIFATLSLIIAGIFLYNSRLFAETSGAQAISSAFFPRMIIYVLIFSSLALLISSFLKRNKGQGEGASKGALSAFLKQHWRVPFMFGWFTVYLILMPIIGFFPSTVLFLLVGYLVLNISFAKKKLVLYVPLSFVLTFIIQFIFENELQVILP